MRSWSPRSMCGLHSGIFSVSIRGVGNSFVRLAPGEVLERTRVCDLVHAAAHEQVAREGLRGRWSTIS